jgi:hypothetical protein
MTSYARSILLLSLSSLSPAACNDVANVGGPRVDAGSDGSHSGKQPPDAVVSTPSDASPSECSLGSVTFRMTGAGLYQSSFSNPGDGVWWYSVSKEDGTPVDIFFNPNTEATCNSCAPLPANAIGQGCNGIPAGGVTASWAGISIGATSSCGGQQCEAVSCAPAGHYVARMCIGCTNFFDSGVNCIDVPFAYPTNAEVVAAFPDAGVADAGPNDPGSFVCGSGASSVTCSSNQYCEVSCESSAEIVPARDGGSCPPHSVSSCVDAGPSCHYQWDDGGAPGPACENAIPAYSCVDQAPSGCLPYGASNTFICACSLQ